MADRLFVATERGPAWERPRGGLRYYEPETTAPPVPTVGDVERQVDPLRWLVRHLQYKPGWTLELTEYANEGGPWHRWLRVYVQTPDSLTGAPTTIIHQIAVPDLRELPPGPPGTPERFWRRWLLNRLIGIETHEACEFFTVDGVKPFFPPHEPGVDPYVVRELEGL